MSEAIVEKCEHSHRAVRDDALLDESVQRCERAHRVFGVTEFDECRHSVIKVVALCSLCCFDAVVNGNVGVDVECTVWHCVAFVHAKVRVPFMLPMNDKSPV